MIATTIEQSPSGGSIEWYKTPSNNCARILNILHCIFFKNMLLVSLKDQLRSLTLDKEQKIVIAFYPIISS